MSIPFEIANSISFLSFLLIGSRPSWIPGALQPFLSFTSPDDNASASKLCASLLIFVISSLI